MRKKISYVLSLLALLFVLPACQQQAMSRRPRPLDPDSDLRQGGFGAVPDVQANKDSWSAISPQEALGPNRHPRGNTLKVRAEANDQGRDRLGAIVVSTGGLQKRVTVRRSPMSYSPPILTESPSL